MSLANLIEIGLTVLSVGLAAGFWVYAARYSEPRDVMLLLGTTLASTSRRNRER